MGSSKSSSSSNSSGKQQLLALRAELSEKELQLVEIQQQHNKLICRSTDAFKRLEVAIRTKDQVIWQLHQALQNKQDELNRQGKLFNVDRQVLFRTAQGHRNSEVEKKEAEISSLKAINSSHMQELQQRDAAISELRKKLQEKEKSIPSQHMLNKMNTLVGQVETLEASLHSKEAEMESQRQICNELKALLRKRESMVAQLQFAEQQLQAALARQTEAYNALEALKDKLQEDKSQMEKNMENLKEELEALDAAAMDDHQLKEDLRIQEACLTNQRKQIQELQRALNAKEVALTSQSKKFHLQHEENQRLIEDFELLKQEYAALKCEKEELEFNLSNLEEKLAASIPSSFPRNQDQEIVEVCGWKNVEFQEPVKPPTPICTSKKMELRDSPKKTAGNENELRSIEEEIGRREKVWRQTEAKMRAELCRRLAQLNELELKDSSKPEIFRSNVSHAQRRQCLFFDHRP